MKRYVKQREGYEETNKELMIYKLRRALYGLKRAPRGWYSSLDRSLFSRGLTENRKQPEAD